MFADLEVTDENMDILNDRGIPCDEGDELIVTITYDVNRADPDVGINSDDVQITSARCNAIDVLDLMDDEELHEAAMNDYKEGCSPCMFCT